MMMTRQFASPETRVQPHKSFLPHQYFQFREFNTPFFGFATVRLFDMFLYYFAASTHTFTVLLSKCILNIPSQYTDQAPTVWIF